MTTYFITRHIGALDWAGENGVHFDVHLSHLLDFDELKSGDVIIGTLPVNIISQINELGVHYIHLSLTIPPHLRGVELTAEQLDECQATLEEFYVKKLAKIIT
ncbi:MAG: CRISPR-associated protein Csx16 [Moraxella sp.]|nr:CRISPR-associated protein Csx16 [Moraxella sp.]